MSKRIITDTTWKSKKVRSIQPPELRSEYAWMMPIFEDNGVAELDAESIWSEAYGAARPNWTPEKVQQVIDEFVRVGLYEKYEADGKTYIYLVGSDKPGHLPPPSQRYSTLPLPSAYGKPTVAQGIAHTGIGSGTGLGSGNGNGSGTEQLQSASRNGSVSLTQKNEEQEPNPNRPRFEIVGNTALTLVALTEHLHCMGMPEIRPTDPLLPHLVRFSEECLAAGMSRTLEVPPEGWDPERDGYDCFVAVNPGDKRYPDPDVPIIDHGLSLRESAISSTYSQFGTALEVLVSLQQYLPELASQGEVPEGMIEYDIDDVEAIMRSCGWPNSWVGTFSEVSLAKIWASSHWAFKVSNYWPAHIKTLADFLKAFSTILEQYDKFYAKLPEGKKPHDLRVGHPPREEVHA